jgi:hypothetical protein
MTSRTEVPEGVMDKLNDVAKSLGYTGKRFDSKVSRWKLLERLLDYSKVHSDLFRL